jgi:hypothetical protein
MSLNNATKARFMERTSEFSTRSSRRGNNLLGWGEEELLTLKQERDSLVASVRVVDQRLSEIPRNSAERKTLGQTKQQLQARIQAIRPKLRGFSGTESHFVAVAREVLCRSTYDAIMKEALRRAEAVAKKLLEEGK